MKNFITGIKKHLQRRTHYKLKFDRIIFINMWARPYYSWRLEGIIIGIGRHYFSSEEFSFKIVFIGFSINIWFTKVYKQ
jgi:hypothetical protein